jgi:beta-lactamase class A
MFLAAGDQQQRRMWRKYAFFFMLGMLCFFGIEKIRQTSILCDSYFDLLNPNSACSNGDAESSEWDYEPLRQHLIQTVENYTESGRVPHIALYFRDLKHGARFSIRENEIFEPASLLKLPILMAILNEADRHPALLDERMIYEKEDSYRFITGPLDNTLTLHSSYTIRELLQKMIQYSDNSSTTLLQNKVNELGLRQNSNTFADLGTMQLVLSGELDNTRLISLVNIFVALYNANYLSPHSSQFALELLVQANFDQGIVGGVPQGILVANKYGMRIGETAKENELHDCGIVYHPIDPYVLCILTADADMKDASFAIQDLSRIVYENIDGMKR